MQKRYWWCLHKTQMTINRVELIKEFINYYKYSWVTELDVETLIGNYLNSTCFWGEFTVKQALDSLIRHLNENYNPSGPGCGWAWVRWFKPFHIADFLKATIYEETILVD